MADMANKIQVTQEQIDPATGLPFTGDRLIQLPNRRFHRGSHHRQ